MSTSTSNFQKHQHRNPIQRYLINNFYQEFFRMLKHTHPETILDVGCGEGVENNWKEEIYYTGWYCRRETMLLKCSLKQALEAEKTLFSSWIRKLNSLDSQILTSRILVDWQTVRRSRQLWWCDRYWQKNLSSAYAKKSRYLQTSI